MQTDRLTLPLASHPAHPPIRVQGVTTSIRADSDGWLLLRWWIEGARALLVPPLAGQGRADGLWRTTCFELFCRKPGGERYVELNLSPSERWAAYDFTAYRAGMEERPMQRPPAITPRFGGPVGIFEAALRLADLPQLPWEFGLSAVLEERGGAKSYWALEHGGAAPDFHDPACFAARLAPRGSA